MLTEKHFYALAKREVKTLAQRENALKNEKATTAATTKTATRAARRKWQKFSENAHKMSVQK